jgi:hypothetical protein
VTDEIYAGGYFSGNIVWNAGNDGSGSGLDADLLDGQDGSYYASSSSLANYVHKNANTMTGSSFKLGFHSGSGGTTFGANHYSMGVDIANGGWSGSNYSDLIIGYHTGIRIGAGYSGIRFYNNSPTTDTNNTGNGNGSESLLMTIGGGGSTTSGANVSINNDLIVGGVIDANGGHGAINITNSSILSSPTSTWTGNPGGAGKIQYHSNRWYIVSDQSSNRIVQFRRDGSDKSYIDNDGNFVGNVIGTASGNALSSHTHQVLATSGNYVWSASTRAQNYAGPGVQTSFVRAADGWPQYGTVLHVGGRGGSDAGGDFQLYAGHGAANGGNYLRVRNADNSASTSDDWTSWRTIWDSGNDGSGSTLDADLLDGQHGSYYMPASTSTIAQAHYVSGNAFSTSAAPDSVLEYAQASGITNTKVAPTGDWYNSIRMGHGDPYTYYSNTIAVKMTGTEVGTIHTQTIQNNNAQGWNKHWHSNNDGSGSGLDADLLDGKDHTNFGATLATFSTTSGTGGRIRCTAPFNTNSGKMFQVTVSLYSSYQIRNYVVAGYMYSSSNQWYSATAIYSGAGTPDIKVGRDANGKAYISIARGSYTGVRVHSMTRGYYTSVGDTYDPWTITENDATENSLTPTTSTTWHSTNDGSGSGLDADLLDGIQGASFLRSDVDDIYTGNLRVNNMYFKSNTNTARNFKMQPNDSNSDVGISMYTGGGSHSIQLYGTSSQYGFLDANWGSWDIKKTKNGAFWVDEGNGLKKVWNAGNDGSGSGLDADLLDGQHASEFASSTPASSLKIYNSAGTVVKTVNGI